MTEGKKEFYIKAEEALKSRGYDYYDGDRDIPGKGRQHANKPDYVAVKDNIIIVGEIKSPAEGPKSASWRQIQNSDSPEFQQVRIEVAKKEKAKILLPEIGGHVIIIRGQIPNYARMIGINFNLPVPILDNSKLMLGYTLPVSESANVEQALSNCQIDAYEKITDKNGSVTYIFDYQDTNQRPATSADAASAMPAYYCILKNYKGLFKKKFDNNAHLLFFPVPDEKYIYLIIRSVLLDQEDSYVCKLLLEMESDLLQPLLNGEKEKFGKRFLVVEVLPCQTSSTSDGYDLHISKKGHYIKSDISLERLADVEPHYIMQGKFNLETADRIL